MRKLIVAAVAATSFFLAASAANAGYWWNGFYYPTCVYTIYGPVCGYSQIGGWPLRPVAFIFQFAKYAGMCIRPHILRALVLVRAVVIVASASVGAGLNIGTASPYVPV